MDGDKKKIHDNYINFYIIVNKLYLYNYSNKIII